MQLKICQPPLTKIDLHTTCYRKGCISNRFVTSSGKQTQKSMVFILPSPKSLTRRLQWRLESMFYSLMNTIVILGRHYHLNESDLKEVFGLIADLHAKTTCLVQK